jgi:peptidoglycan/LPS O-acetylase OafA/YrhL
MNPLHHKSYRPDIDGLRAIAILGVLIFHLDKSLLPGGFLGVDVFFVISGFLITSIIRRDIEGDGFSIVRFYERRIRRIMPAFFVVMLAVLIAAYAWILPDEIVPFGKSMRYALFSFGNVHFHSAVQDYFNSDAAQAPLLHTWSLGVEEQFYFIFPFVLLAFSKCCKSSRVIAGSLLALLLFSFIACLHKGATSATSCFFLLPYRAWEMLAGALLAYLPISFKRPAWVSAVAGWLGLGLVLASMVVVSETAFRPGVMALGACAGSMLLIFAGATPQSAFSASRLLSWGPVVGIGLISYSVYLWHWPLIAFREHYLPEATAINHAILAAASLLLGWASWKWVENPFRHTGFLSRRTIFIGWLLVALAFLGAGMFIKSSDGLIQRYNPEVRAILKARERNEDFPTDIKENWSPEMAPVYGDKSQPPSIALWGDSHAHALMPWLDKRAKEARQAVKLLSMDGQIPVPGLVVRGERDENRMRCVNESMKLILESNTIDTVILHARWAFYLEGYNEAAHEKNPTNVVSYHGQPQQTQAEREAFYANLIREGISQLLEAGKKVVLIYPVPEARINIPDFLAKRLIEGEPLVETIPLPSFADRQRQPMAALDSIPDHPKLVRIKPYERLMNGEHLIVMAGGKPLYIDDDHLSVAGLDFIEDLLDAALPSSTNQVGD